MAGPTDNTVQGRIGAALRGYNGTGTATRGYNGSGVNGYNGSGVNGYNGCKVFGDGFNAAAIGPIESIAQSGGVATLVILGQPFEINADDSTALARGDFAVAAVHPRHGTVVYHVGIPYVAGVSTIQLKAPVTGVNAGVGTASLGLATVDYTALLSADPDAAPVVGQSLVVAGTQPVLGGVVLAGPSSGATVGCSPLNGRM